MKQKISIVVILLILACCIAGIAKWMVSNNKDKEPNVMKKSDILVTYFTATGNTEKVAEMIAEAANASMYKIKPSEPYTSDDLDYNNDNCRANREMQDDSARPKITENAKDLDKYQVVFLGYPIWWETAPKIINTWIESNKDSLKGKKVVTFCTSGGSSITKSNKDLRKTYPEINWIDGEKFSITSSKTYIEKWINTLKIN